MKITKFATIAALLLAMTACSHKDSFDKRAEQIVGETKFSSNQDMNSQMQKATAADVAEKLRTGQGMEDALVQMQMATTGKTYDQVVAENQERHNTNSAVAREKQAALEDEAEQREAQLKAREVNQ